MPMPPMPWSAARRLPWYAIHWVIRASAPRTEHAPHAHCDRDKTYLVLEGRGEITVGEEVQTVGPGDFAFAAADVVHAVRNTGDERLVVFVAMSPPP